MPDRPIVLIHGYSATSEAFDEWRKILMEWGYPPELIQTCSYVSLTDGATIPDLAAAFDEALKSQPGLDEGEPFDAMVHSTGMLVLRTWLLRFPESRHRLKHLIGLAPASFGSPLAHQGRSYLGRAVKGNPVKGPDFRAAGDKILEALELASTYTWDLALQDLLGAEPFYGAGDASPFVAVFCGTDGYPFPMSVVNQPGTDGTVRLAGAALNTRKFDIDMRASVELNKRERLSVADWSNPDIPVVAIKGVDHSSIMTAPTPALKDLVQEALAVRSSDDGEAWLKKARAHSAKATEPKGRSWQQLNFRVVDGHGRPVDDYSIEFHVKRDSKWVSATSEGVPVSVHAFGADKSYRCFHVDVEKLLALGSELAVTLHITTGTRFAQATGWVEAGLRNLANEVGAAAALKLARRGRVEFFFPNTTTLVEIRVDSATIADDSGAKLVEFHDQQERIQARDLRREKEAEAQRQAEDEALQEALAEGLRQLEEDAAASDT